MLAVPRIAGKRVELRPLREGDFSYLERILQDDSVARWWGRFDERRIREDIMGDRDLVLLMIEADGEIVGFLQFGEEADPDYRHASIDIAISSAFQGKGYGPDAIAAVSRFLIDERGHHRLTIDPRASNEHAIRAYAKVGFRPVGIMRQYERDDDGVWHDGLLMDLLAAELRTIS